MALKANGFWAAVLAIALAVGLSAQAQPQAPAAPQAPTFRVMIDAVTMDAIVKDENGRFVPDLTKDDFEIFEDGVKQEIVSMNVITGGRVVNLLEAPPPAAPEGIILPPRRVVNDTSGRIFLFFVDDLHLQFGGTGRVKSLFDKIAKELVHEGDLFGVVSSGPSSISIDMTYDRKRLAEAAKKIHGDGLKPSEIIQRGTGFEGIQELRHRAHVAFSTMLDALANLEKVHNRRKALVWVSEGYDFNPFQEARYGLREESSPYLQNQSNQRWNQRTDDDGNTRQELDSLLSQQKQNETFSDADLAMDLGEVTRAANRANTTIYTIDPRGLVAGTDIDEPVDPMEWGEYVRKSQDTMRVLAEDTGGLAVVNQNDFDKALKRIDADTSDYYVLGYYSNNPDPLKRRFKIDVKASKNGKELQVNSRTEYVRRAAPVPPPVVPAPAGPPPAAQPPAGR
jgi:VWFA-related protein